MENVRIKWLYYVPNASNLTTSSTIFSCGSYTQNVANSGISYVYYGLDVNQFSGNGEYYLDISKWQIFGVEKISAQADWQTTVTNKPGLST